jgi:hypothetical protein
MSTDEALSDRSPDRDVAERMAGAATAWLESLDAEQRALAHWDAPCSGPEIEAERLRWYYTPTDHGGLPLNRQRPAQQSLAMQLVASGLSTAGYVTVCTVLGWENVLDHVEDFKVDWGRERGRDPGLYYVRVFGQPGGSGPWGWRFGGHHVSLNNLVVDGRVRAVTPSFRTRPGRRCWARAPCALWARPRTSRGNWSAHCPPTWPAGPCCWTGRRRTSSAATGPGSLTATR